MFQPTSLPPLPKSGECRSGRAARRRARLANHPVPAPKTTRRERSAAAVAAGRSSVLGWRYNCSCRLAFYDAIRDHAHPKE